MTESEKYMDLGNKVSILFNVKEGLKPEVIAEMFNTTINTIADITANEQQIMNLFESSYLARAVQLPLKRGIYPHMENVLYCWYMEQKGFVLNKVLTEKAKELLEILGEPPTIKNVKNFTGSKNWVIGFKQRFEIPIFRLTPLSLPPVRKATEDLSTVSILDERVDNLNDHNPNESTSSDTTIEYKAESELDIIDQYKDYEI